MTEAAQSKVKLQKAGMVVTNLKASSMQLFDNIIGDAIKYAGREWVEDTRSVAASF